MTRKSRSSFLDEGIALLIRYFGIDKVRAALAKASNGATEVSERPSRHGSTEPDHHSPSVTSLLDMLQDKDEEKYRLLADFYIRLKNRLVLPESQDIRHFAHLVGLKEVSGKSRKDMVPTLMRFLLEQPKERLQVDIEAAASVSEYRRQQGFSVLTDKLLGDKQDKKE